jgi:hypothetical protein
MVMTKLIRVKVPLEIFRALPSKPEARNRFIIAALEKKLASAESNERQATHDVFTNNWSD